MAFCHLHWQFTTWSRADIYYAKTPEERWTAIQMGIVQIALGLERLGVSKVKDEADKMYAPEQRRVWRQSAKQKRRDT